MKPWVLHFTFESAQGGLNKLQDLVERGWLSEADQRAIQAGPDWKLQAWRELKLYQLPVYNVLLGRLMDQAEDQYWLDVENEVDQSERCKVQVDFDKVKQRFAGDPQDAENWARCLSELNLVRRDEIEGTFKFTHQSWGEFFAAYRLMRWSPETLKQKRLHGTPAEQAQAETLHHRLFERARMRSDCPSAEEELANQQKDVDAAWAPFMAVKERLLASLTAEPLQVKLSALGEGLQDIEQCRESDPIYWEKEIFAEGPADTVLFNCNAFGVFVCWLSEHQGPWHESATNWSILLEMMTGLQLETAFWSRAKQTLREALCLTHADAEDAVSVCVEAEKKATGRFTLPPVGDLRDVLSLALQCLTKDEALAWLQALACEGGDWRMTVHAAAHLRARLEPPDADSGRLTWWPPRRPAPVFQHLRRLLLLTSVDAGEACKERLEAGGVLQVLDAPLLDDLSRTSPALDAHWQQVRQQEAFKGGVDLRWRLWAAQGLSELKDNLRWQAVTLPESGQVGLVLKPALWLWVGRPGGQHFFQMGQEAFLCGQPTYLQSLRSFRVAAYPAVSMEYRAFLAAHAPGPVRVSEPGRGGLDDPDFNLDLQPMVRLNWYEMGLFEQWQARMASQIMPDAILRKPTEEEWEAAAKAVPVSQADRGVTIYPFPQLLRHPGGADAPDDLPFVFNYFSTRWGRTAPVGVFSLGLNAIGADMFGNVSQRCANRWDGQSDYKGAKKMRAPMGTPLAEWQQRLSPDQLLAPGDLLSVRGDSYRDPMPYRRAAARSKRPAGDRDNGLGVRWVLLPHDHGH